MPEIKNTFTSGRMNKDLDERLLPKVCCKQEVSWLK